MVNTQMCIDQFSSLAEPLLHFKSSETLEVEKYTSSGTSL